MVNIPQLGALHGELSQLPGGLPCGVPTAVPQEGGPAASASVPLRTQGAQGADSPGRLPVITESGSGRSGT